MSLSDAASTTRVSGPLPGIRQACAVLLIAMATGLAACADGTGFRPMYGVLSNSAEVDQRLAQIDIAPIPGRVGQRIRNELVFQTDTSVPSAAPVYRLEIAITENLTSTLVAKDGEAASQIYLLTAAFRLIRTSDKKVILADSSFGRASFERVQSIYSNVRAREDAENRAAKTVSTDLKIRLSAFLSRPQ